MDKWKYSDAWKTCVHTRIHTWIELCTLYRNDLAYSTLAQTKQNLQEPEFREMTLHSTFCVKIHVCVCVLYIIYNVYYMWRYQHMVFTFKLENLGWLTCKAYHWPWHVKGLSHILECSTSWPLHVKTSALSHEMPSWFLPSKQHNNSLLMQFLIS